MRFVKIVLSICALWLSAAAHGQYAPPNVNGNAFTCSSNNTPSNSNSTYCDHVDIAKWQTVLSNAVYNGQPCYTYPDAYEPGVYWMWDNYNGGVYWLIHDIWLFGSDTNSSATYPGNCPFALVPTYPPAVIEGQQYVGYITQPGAIFCFGGAGHVPNTGQPTTGSIYQCSCPASQFWKGYWGTLPSGACETPDVPYGQSRVIAMNDFGDLDVGTQYVIDPPCTNHYIRNQLVKITLNDNRVLAAPAGSKVQIQVGTAVNGTNFIPDPGSYVLDGKGRPAVFANGFKQFMRFYNRQTGAWLMYATFQVPADVGSLQLFLAGDNCVGPIVGTQVEVQYALATVPQ